MQRKDILEFARLLELGAPDRTSTAVWLQFRCPFAPWRHKSRSDRSASFGIKVEDTDRSRYWCFACHASGKYHELAYELGHLRGKAAQYLPIGEQIKQHELIKTAIIREWIEDFEDQHETSEKVNIEWPAAYREFEYRSAAGHPYLRQRGISWATALGLGLRYDPFQRRILFPVKSRSGQFAGFSGRRIDRAFADTDDGPIERNGDPYLKVRDYHGLRKSEFLLGEHRIRATDPAARGNDQGRPLGRRPTPLILVEGLFDYAQFNELGLRNTVGLMGSNLTPTKISKIIDYGLGVILFMDNDEAGHDAVEKITSQLYGRVPISTVEYPEGYDGSDPGSLPPDVVFHMLKGRRQVLRA